MASTILGIAKKLRNLTQKTSIASLRRSVSTKTGTTKRKETLFSRITALVEPSMSIVPVLDRWAQEGRVVRYHEFRCLVHAFRSRQRFNHALQISEWMSCKGSIVYSSHDLAEQLDLIGRVHGVKAAESFLNSLGDVEDKERVYRALLGCYVRERLVDKSRSFFQQMKDLGYVSTLGFDNMLVLYKDTDQVENIPGVFLEMKNFNCPPDHYSYKICIEAYGMRSDLRNMERILEELESQTQIPTQWITYALVAGYYIKAGNREKALKHLRRCEELVGKDAVGYNFLITHHAELGYVEEVLRLWRLQKASRKKLLNKDYMTIIGMLAKLGEFKRAEKAFKKWESSCKFYDFRVHNTLLTWYCKKGLTEKAESTLDEFIAKGKMPMPISWCIVATGYLDDKNMDKAFECFKKALAMQTKFPKWKPEPTLPMAILDWLVYNRDVSEVETFMDLTSSVMPVSREMYHNLIMAYKRSRKEVGGILERMHSDGIYMNEETEKILKTRVL